jgi:chaperonin cofactor prefoldin
MEVYYTKKEYKDMQRSYEKRIKQLEKQIAILSDKLKNLKKKDVAD